MTVDVKFIIHTDSCFRPSQLQKEIQEAKKNQTNPRVCKHTATDNLVFKV